MKYCPNCGEPVVDSNNIICPLCGHLLSEGSAPLSKPEQQNQYQVPGDIRYNNPSPAPNQQNMYQNQYQNQGGYQTGYPGPAPGQQNIYQNRYPAPGGYQQANNGTPPYPTPPYAAPPYPQQYQTPPVRKNHSTIQTVILIFMIIGCVGSIFAFFIPLIWMLPITIIVYDRMKKGEPVGIALKIVTLLFVSLIAGICLLVTEDL